MDKMENTKSSAFVVPESSSRKRKYSDSQEKDGNCSYTSMIAQAIMKTHFKRATLSEIYNYMANAFDILKKRGNGWRNCVRHTLSLNECFVKLNRPENGRSCNWTVHPSYFEAFLRGDYRKRRSNRKKVREAQWMSDNRCVNYPTSSSVPYLQNDNMSGIRPIELERMNQQTPPPPPSSMWHSYVSSLENNIPKTTNPQDIAYAYHNMYNNESQQHQSSNTDKISPVTAVGTSNHNIHTSVFPVPSYSVSPSSSNSNDFNEHHATNTMEGHGGRLRYNGSGRSCVNTQPLSSCKGNGGERVAYDSGGRSSYSSHDQMAQHFQIDSACYGNFSTRSYRTEYF